MFNRVYRLEIQSVMLVCDPLPLYLLYDLQNFYTSPNKNTIKDDI